MDVHLKCPICGKNVGNVVRSEVGAAFGGLLRQRKCENGHITRTRVYEEIINPTQIAASLIPLEGEAQVA